MSVKRSVKESVIEAELLVRVGILNGICVKIATPGTRGFFDRLVVLPGGIVIFVELKRPRGGRLSKHQMWYAERLEALGAVVAVVRDSADIDALLAAHEKAAPPAGGAAHLTSQQGTNDD